MVDLSVADRIRDYILTEGLDEGSRLPSERRLAERLGVSRAQVRSAYRQLETGGTIRAVSPRIRVVASPRGETGGLLADTIAVMTHLEPAAASQTPSGNQHQALFVGVAHAMQGAGWAMMVLSPDRLDEPALSEILRNRPRGIIAIGRSAETTAGALLLERLRAASVPVAVAADNLEAGALDILSVDTVATDHAAGARLLVEHLHAAGCRRIAMQTIDPGSADTGRLWYRRRRQGFLDACEALGVAPLDVLLPRHPHAGRGSPRERFEQTVRILAEHLRPVMTGPKPADAVMLLSDGSHAESAVACRLLGREPGRDVRIAGYDNYWPMCPGRAFEATPPTATVDKCDDRVGELLVGLIRDRLGGALDDAPQRLTVQPRLLATAEQAIDPRALARSIAR